MPNKQIVDIFEQMADLMEILGQDRFRINTARKTARTLHDCTEDLSTLAANNQLETLSGIGKSTAEKISEFLDTGNMSAYQDLLSQVPQGLPDLLKIPGVGPKAVSKIWKQLDVTNSDELLDAAQSGKLEQLEGFGKKKAESIIRGIEFLNKSQGRIILSYAAALADLVAGQLRLKTKLNIEFAGSLRRGCETIGDIDLLAPCDNPDQAKKAIEIFTTLEGVQDILAAGDTKSSIRFHWPTICPDTVQIDLRLVPSESIGATRQYFTGSKEHNVRLREIAVKKNLKLNEYGLFKNNKMIAGKTEQDIYKKLSLQYVPPTLREDRGEVELAQKKKLPALVQLSDVKGDMHMHTPASDGRSPLEDMVEAARIKGYQYIAITDHSQSSVIANGLDVDRLLNHIHAIRELDKQYKDITILASAEVDLLSDGKLDYPDEILAQLDFVISSVHSGMTGDKEKTTRRILKAMENPYLNCIGHPTGRLINAREPMDLDMTAIIKQAAQTKTTLEVNCHPMRLDLKDIHVRRAIQAGVKLMVDTDAHDTNGLSLMTYGIATAQRGWATKKDVLNCQPLSTIKKWISAKRKLLA